MQMRDKLAALIDESAGRFRIDRAVYSDPDVFDAELNCFYEGGWLYLCHESQIKQPGEYFATRMGRQPVFLVRQKDGSVGGFINACAHRGATLVPTQSGKVSTFTCRFHGWVFALDGRCMKIKNQESGAYANPDCRTEWSLTPIPRIDTYRGFVFGSLRADVAPLGDYLGPTRPWIDLMVDQSPEGLEVLPGSSTYIVRGNWKMQAENGVDGYHVSTVHRVFAATVANREAKLGLTGMQRTESGRLTGNVASGGYDFGNGHMAIWAQHTDPTKRPIYQQKERLERAFTPAKVDWMMNRGRNLFLFPNLLLMDNPSSQIRTIQPVSCDRAEVTVRCVAPIGERARRRAGRACANSKISTSRPGWRPPMIWPHSRRRTSAAMAQRRDGTTSLVAPTQTSCTAPKIPMRHRSDRRRPPAPTIGIMKSCTGAFTATGNSGSWSAHEFSGRQ